MPRIITYRKGLPTLRSRILQVLVAAQTPLTARTIGQRCGLSYKAVNKSLSTMVPQKLVNMRGFYNVNGQKVPAMYWVSEASDAAPAPAPAPAPTPTPVAKPIAVKASTVRALKVGDLTLTEARAIYKELSEIFA